MTSGIKHKPGSFRNNGNTLRYNINNTRATNFTMYFSITKIGTYIEKTSHSFLAYFLLSDMVGK